MKYLIYLIFLTGCASKVQPVSIVKIPDNCSTVTENQTDIIVQCQEETEKYHLVCKKKHKEYKCRIYELQDN